MIGHNLRRFGKYITGGGKGEAKGAFTHTRGEANRGDAARRTRVRESATESKLVRRGESRRGEAVPRGIASHVVQYVHSGSMHT